MTTIPKIQISYQEWKTENHLILHSNVLHAIQPSQDGDICDICGLAIDKNSEIYISRYAKALAKQLKIGILQADHLIAAGKFTRGVQHVGI